MIESLRPLAYLSAWGLLLAGAQAQTILQWDGVLANERLGSALDTLADVDHDGVDDFVIGVPFSAVGGYQAGAVRVHSGASGMLLYSLLGDAPLDHAGTAVAGLGDLDGDGRGDFAVGHPDSDRSADGAGQVRVHSGAGGAVRFEWNGALAFEGYGSSLAAAGDPDGDGVGDVLIGAWRSGPIAGRVELRSGATGALLRNHVGANPEDRLGWSVAGLGDVDGDGRDDYAVGAIQEGYGPGYVQIVSGSTGGLIRVHTGMGDFESFGAALCGLGDVNGDGYADYAVGAITAVQAQAARGRVDLYSGHDGSVLWSLNGLGDLERFGFALAGGRDASGDGVPDLVVGAPFGAGWRGRVALVSGADGTILRQWIGSQFSDRFGFAVAQTSDLDLDGRPDVLVGAPREDLGAADAGVARALSVASGCESFSYCTAKRNSAGCEPAMGWNGSPVLSGSGDFAVHASRLLADSLGVFVWSTQPTVQPLLGGTLCAAPPLGRSAPLLTGSASGDCGGRMTLALPPSFLTAQGWSPGTTIHVQAWSRDLAQTDGSASSSSDGLAFVLCP